MSKVQKEGYHINAKEDIRYHKRTGDISPSCPVTHTLAGELVIREGSHEAFVVAAEMR